MRLGKIKKIFVFGDSIAYGKWDLEGGWVARLRRQIDAEYNIGRTANIQVYNLSWPGELATHLVDRFKSEFLDRRPGDDTLVVLAVGLNDSSTSNWLKGVQSSELDFKQVFNSMISLARDQLANVVCIGLTPVNEHEGYSNDQVIRFDGYITDICQQLNVPKLELFKELVSCNFKQYLVDAVHPNDAGHKLLAEQIISFIESTIK